MDEQLRDRVAGVLLGQACGDALGVPYEFGSAPLGERAEMLGGGLGDFAPGEWSDDTSMAYAVAEGLASAADLEARLDAIAAGFLRWIAADPADVGIQTRQVLGAVRAQADEAGVGAAMAEEARRYAAAHAHSAGNGALMRTSPVALAYLDDRAGCAEAARRVAELTHADPLAGESCVLWSEAIRVAVTEQRLDLVGGLDLLSTDRAAQWAGWIEEAVAGPPARFSPNGFTVHALQAAWSAIVQTDPSGPAHIDAALQEAIRIGNDTDTVGAIAGGLLGARWGASALLPEWRSAVHGWPGRRADDLAELALTLAG